MPETARARRSFKSSTWTGASAGAAPPVVLPSSVSAVSAWLRVANATSDGNGISSVPDMLNTNPAVQSVGASKPVIEMSANGLPCMRFGPTVFNVLRWPITPQSSASQYAGWGFWFKPDDVATSQRLIRVATGSNAADGHKLTLGVFATALFSVNASSTGSVTDAKIYTPGPSTTSWQFVTIEYNKDRATDEARFITTVNGVSITATITGTQDISAGLFAATGNILIGNGSDTAASFRLKGLIGPNIFAFASAMPGAELGLLTNAARASLMNYEAPT